MITGTSQADVAILMAPSMASRLTMAAQDQIIMLTIPAHTAEVAASLSCTAPMVTKLSANLLQVCFLIRVAWCYGALTPAVPC